MLELITKLISSKREGPYWDFKQEVYSNNSDLLHDIICFSNSLYKGEKYIIIGVSDPKEGCKILGLPQERKTQADYIDFLRSMHFASDNRPEIELRTLKIDDKDIDVIIIYDSQNKPFYLSKDYMGIRANYIYTRIGDTNTPKDKSADYNIIEKMWRQKFGLDLEPSERYKSIIKDIDNWKIDMGNKDIAYYNPLPEYQIEFSKPHEGWEPYSYFFTNEKSYFGIAIFKYLSTPLFEMEYGYLDEFRIPIAIPKIETFSSREPYFYYYFLQDSLRYDFFRLIGLKSFMFSRKKEYLPFLFFTNENEKKDFHNYLSSISDINSKIEQDDDAEYVIKRMEELGHGRGNLPKFISFVVKEYYKWKKIAT